MMRSNRSGNPYLCNMLLDVTSSEMQAPIYAKFYGSFRRSCLIVAKECYGRKGVWAHEIFDFINASYFGGRLPHAHIIWELTPYGGCHAWACCSHEKRRQPVVTLHPALLESSAPDGPWGISRRWLGPALIFDTLLHECIHIHIETRLGGQDGPTSHNCDRWVRQINRLAPILGFEGVEFGRSKVVRVPIQGAPLTLRRKRPTRVVRTCTGNVPFAVGAGFPMSLRRYQGIAARYYSTNSLPPGVPQL